MLSYIDLLATVQGLARTIIQLYVEVRIKPCNVLFGNLQSYLQHSVLVLLISALVVLRVHTTGASLSIFVLVPHLTRTNLGVSIKDPVSPVSTQIFYVRFLLGTLIETM